MVQNPAGVGLYLGPGFALYCLLLNEVAYHPVSSVTLWGFPGESAGSPCHVTHLQVSRRSGQVYRGTEQENSASVTSYFLSLDFI